jgi:hypothetical protein
MDSIGRADRDAGSLAGLRRGYFSDHKPFIHDNFVSFTKLKTPDPKFSRERMRKCTNTCGQEPTPSNSEEGEEGWAFEKHF